MTHPNTPAARTLGRASLLALAAALLSLTACGTGTATRLTLTGSTSVTPFVELLAEEYQHDHPGELIDVQGLGSSAGIRAVLDGVSELGMSSRALSEEEAAQLDQILIARDALAIIVHPSNPVTDLTGEQIRAIFQGTLTDWGEVGGRASPIVLVSREAGSGTFSAFEDLVMGGEPPSDSALRQGSNGSIRQIVADNPNAIGYISLGIVDPTVRAIAIDGVEPQVETVEANTYLLVRPFLIISRKQSSLSPLATAFLGYVQSPEGQAMLTQQGLVPGDALP